MNKSARGAGFMASLLIIAALLYTLFASPSLCARKDNSYIGTMERLGLQYIDEEDASADVVEKYAYADADLGTVISLAEPGVAYPAAIVRLATAPFGLGFDTKILAVVYSLIIALGGGLAVSGLYRHSRIAAIASGLGFITLSTYAPVIGYLNSLYNTGAIIAFALLFIGVTVHCLSMPKGGGILPVVSVLASGALLLRSADQMMILAPFVIIIAALCIVHACPEAARRGTYLLCCGVVLLWCGYGTVTGFMSSADIHSDATNYMSVFQGYLTVSDDASGDLHALGLPAEQAADIGRSYYEPDESFVYPPRTAENADMLEKLTLSKRALFCITHPQRVAQMAAAVENHFLDAYNDRIATSDGQMRFMRPSPMLLIDLLLPMSGETPLTSYMLLAALLCLLCVFAAAKGTGMGKLAVALAVLMLGLACYFPACLVMMGQLDISAIKVSVFFFGWLGLMTTITALLTFSNRLFRWLAEKGETLRSAENTIHAKPRAIPVMSRRLMVGLCALCCAVLCLWMLLPEVHIGGINNGDYGRMMEQTDLYWTEDITYDLSAQMGSRVVEDYTYREPFQLKRLTPADPTYSLLYPSLIVRLWSVLTGNIFSTRVLAAVLMVITALSILLIVYNLHPILGNWTLLPAAVLIVMLMDENYVAMYNSLYGESMLSVGLIMTLACAVHLITMPRGGKGSLTWLIILAVSVRFMTCSKAQMALALPGGLALIAGLSIYHHPKGMARLTAFSVAMSLCAGLICWDTWSIYKKNKGVSERQTVWQSVFYGALMISDDPDATMAELGVDPKMKPDIGKHAYFADEDYVYAPMSEEADAALYDKVNTMTMVKYYLRHPKYFIKMLDRAAQESVTLHTSFMAYTDEEYSEHKALQRLTLWQNLRPFTALRAFWQYVLLYGAALAVCLRTLLRRGANELAGRGKLFALLFLCIMCIGSFQYPLTVVGNGFADNNKQLYCFMLCHDLLMLFAMTAGAFFLKKRGEGRSA